MNDKGAWLWVDIRQVCMNLKTSKCMIQHKLNVSCFKWAPIETKAILEVSVGNLHNSLRSEEHLNLILDSHTHTVLHFTFLIIDYPNLVPRPTRPNKVIFSQTKASILQLEARAYE